MKCITYSKLPVNMSLFPTFGHQFLNSKPLKEEQRIKELVKIKAVQFWGNK